MKNMKNFLIKTGQFTFGMALAASLLIIGPGQLKADTNPQADMLAAEKEFEEAGKAFEATSKATGNLSQKTGQMSWSDFASGKTRQIPDTGQTSTANAMPQLQGSPETGYAGTWTDPANGDIVTTVIAPRPQQNSYPSQPIIVQPDVDGWNYAQNNGGYLPQWPVAPGNPGYPGTPPAQYPGGSMPPQYYPQPGPSYFPHLPSGVQPGYRPLRPTQRPPSASLPGQNPAGNMPPTPEYNIPGWKPFPPSGNQAPMYPAGGPTPPTPEYNIPGWKPFPPSGNQAYPPRPFNGMRPPMPRGAY